MIWGIFATLTFQFVIILFLCLLICEPLGAEHVCLQLWISKECLAWVSTHLPPLETPSGCQLDVFQPDPYCSAAQTSLLCRLARGSWSFVRDGKTKQNKKRCGGVQCLGALQIIKISCFSPIHFPLSYWWAVRRPPCKSEGGNPPRSKQTDCGVCVSVCVCRSGREETTGLAVIQTTHSLQAGWVY